MLSLQGQDLSSRLQGYVNCIVRQLRKNAEFFLDGAPLADLGDGPKEFAALIEKDTCFVVAKDVRAGEHELEVRAKSSSGNDYVAMSHVLFF